jgi:hypothetical protein
MFSCSAKSARALATREFSSVTFALAKSTKSRAELASVRRIEYVETEHQ